MTPYTALCTYLVQRDRVDDLAERLRRHWPTLRRHGLVTDKLPIIYFGEDYSGPFFVEALTWVDALAPGKAYWIREINDIWTDLYNFTEMRNGRPGIDYPTVRALDVSANLDNQLPATGVGPGLVSPGALDWDEMYKSGRYLDSWDLDCVSPELVDFLAKHVPVNDKATALDLGCGSGMDCIALAKAGYLTSGVDISGEALVIASRRAMEAGVVVRWYQASALELPHPDASIDLVTDRGCFHHIPEQDQTRYAEEVARILKPGGRLLLRGCRVKQFPFIPITANSLALHFPQATFELGEVLPVDLVTRARVLAGNMCILSRKGRIAN